MQPWEYKVAYIDFIGRISVEGSENVIGEHVQEEHDQDDCENRGEVHAAHAQ